MKSFREYLAESEYAVSTPVAGDAVIFNIREECLIESAVIKSSEGRVIINADSVMMEILEDYGLVEGYTTDMDQAESEDDAAMQSVQDIDEGVMSAIDQDLQDIAASEDFDQLYDALNGGRGGATAAWLQDQFARIAQHRRLHPDDQEEDIIEIMMDQLVKDYGDTDLPLRPMDEAEYQGRKVKLGKPMRGDVKKFKVYVKDPATGNIKKVNFGDPNMRIKKNIPGRRKNFRARHRCATPGPRTKARYWSCRMW